MSTFSTKCQKDTIHGLIQILIKQEKKAQEEIVGQAAMKGVKWVKPNIGAKHES